MAEASSASSTTTENSTQKEPDEPRSYLRSPIVSIVVAPEKVEFYFHKDLLRSRSEYFRNALKDDWTEGISSKLEWDDEAVSAVEAMGDWMYSRPISMNATKGIRQLFQCYRLGQKRLLPDFKNNLIDLVRTSQRKIEESFTVAHLAMLKELKLEDTEMWNYVLRSTLCGLHEAVDWYLKDDAKQCRVMAHALDDPALRYIVLKEMFTYSQKPWTHPRELLGCHFHDHSDGSQCS